MVVAKWELFVDIMPLSIMWEQQDDAPGAVINHTSPLVITLPANRAVDDIVVVHISGGTGFSGPSTPPTGWTELQDVASSLINEHYIMWRRMNGTEGSTVNVTVSNGLDWSWRAMRVSGAHTTQALEEAGFASTDTPSVNPGAVAPSWGTSNTTLFLALAGSNNATDPVVTFPSGYTNTRQNATTENSRAAACSKTALTTSENPSEWTFTVTPGNIAHTASTVAIRAATG